MSSDEPFIYGALIMGFGTGFSEIYYRRATTAMEATIVSVIGAIITEAFVILYDMLAKDCPHIEDKNKAGVAEKIFVAVLSFLAVFLASELAHMLKISYPEKGLIVGFVAATVWFFLHRYVIKKCV